MGTTLIIFAVIFGLVALWLNLGNKDTASAAINFQRSVVWLIVAGIFFSIAWFNRMPNAFFNYPATTTTTPTVTKGN